MIILIRSFAESVTEEISFTFLSRFVPKDCATRIVVPVCNKSKHHDK